MRLQLTSLDASPEGFSGSAPLTVLEHGCHAHTVAALSLDSSVRLLRQLAFESGLLPPGVNTQLLVTAATACGGLPLALTTLGGSLKGQTPQAIQVREYNYALHAFLIHLFPACCPILCIALCNASQTLLLTRWHDSKQALVSCNHPSFMALRTCSLQRYLL